MRIVLVLPAAMLAVALAWARPAAAQATRVVAKFNDWTVYVHEATQTKICFAMAAPRASEPASANRAVIAFFVSSWPKEGVKSEASVKIGYPFKKGSDATVTIGVAAFRLFTKDDRAYLGDATEELKLIEAMKKGGLMVVQGTSERGTSTKDTFSLAGLGQALQTVTSGCP